MNDKPRGFRLIVLPHDIDTYGLRLEETNGSSSSEPISVAVADWRHTRRVQSSVQDALRVSRIARTAAWPGRKRPIRLAEEAGVRLALVLVATDPIKRQERVEAMAAGIESMSDEEAYYWYSKCMGEHRRRARRALRLLLAEE